MDKYIKAAFRSAAVKLANFVAENFIMLFMGVCLAALLFVAGYWNWEFWGEATYRDGKLVELRVDRGRIIQQSLILIGGFIALFLAMWRTWTAKLQADASLQQVAIAQRGQNTDRYVKAVEMLSSSSATVRRAALLALKEIAALDMPRSYVVARQTLQTFIQDASNRQITALDADARGQLTDDIGAAFVIFGQLKATYDPQGEFLSDLTSVPILVLNGIYLTNANCVFTDYAGVCFQNAVFTECGLIHSLMIGVQFYNCTFSNVLVNYADFSDCGFHGCTFRGGKHDFRQASLRGAVFENSRFEEDGRIYTCDISGADFTRCLNLVPENIVDCAASSANPPKFPPAVEIKYRKIGPERQGRIDPSLEGKWFVWSNALKIFPREEAIYRAEALGIDRQYFLQTAFGEFNLRK